MANDAVEENISPLETILSNIYFNKRLTTYEFEFLKVSLTKQLLDFFIVRYYLHYVPTKLCKGPEGKSPADLLKEILLCKIDDLPMYINSFFKEVVKWRCTYNI